jgi:hypothetical protein
MLPVVEFDPQPSAAMLQENYYVGKAATSLFIQQNLPEIQRGEFAGELLWLRQ